MAKKANAFRTELFEALDRLSALDHGAAISNANVTNAIKAATARLAKARASGRRSDPFGLMGMGTTLALPDFHRSEGWLKSFPYKPRMTSDEAYLSLAQEMENRLQGQMLVAAFEVTERHLKHVAGEILFQQRTESGSHKFRIPFDKSAFHKRETKWQEKSNSHLVGTPEYFKAYVGKAYRDGMGVFLRQLRDRLPLTVSSEKLSVRFGHLQQRYEAVEFCRHQLVHAFGVYAPEKLSRFDKDVRKLVKDMTRKSELTGEQTLLPTIKQVDRSVEYLSGIIIFVHRGVSDAFGFEPCL